MPAPHGQGGPAPRWRRPAAPTRGDLIAGLTVLAYLVPQVMAYATIAGLPAIVGLWAALPALLVYPLLGSSRLLSLGPESSVALLSAAAIGPLAAGDPSRAAGLAAALAVAVGLIGVAAWLLRLGFVADLLSQPVLVGYMAGIGVLMIDGQLDHLFGVSTQADGLLRHWWAVVTGLGTAAWQVPALAGVVLVILFTLDRRHGRVPGPLLGVIGAAALAGLLAAAGHPVPLIGPVPQGLPVPALPAVAGADVWPLLVAATGVTLVAFTDTALTARAFQRPGDDAIDTDAELRALALGNLATGALQGMPVSSSGSRTAVARAAGATSASYSLAALLGLVVVLLAAAPLLSVLPQAGLAALVVFAGVKLIDVAGFRTLGRFSVVELALALATTLAVLALGILVGILVAVALSVLAMLARVARPQAAALGFVPGVPGMHNIDDFAHAREVRGLLIFRYDSRLFFANAQDFRAQARAMIAARQPGLRWFAVNCEAIVDVDSTALAMLIDLCTELRDDGLTLALVRAKQELVGQLDTGGVFAVVDREHVYPTLPALVAAYRHATG